MVILVVLVAVEVDYILAKLTLLVGQEHPDKEILVEIVVQV